MKKNWVLEILGPYMHGWDEIRVPGQTCKNLTLKKALSILGKTQKANPGWQVRIRHMETGNLLLGCM